MVRNLARLSKNLGMQFDFPHERFPVNSLQTMRGYYFAEAFGKTEGYFSKVFEVCWGKGVGISVAQNLKPYVESLDLDFVRFISFNGGQSAKGKLKADTHASFETSVFGPITYFFDGAEMYWGDA